MIDKTKEEIEIEFSKAIKQADEIEAVANNITKVAKFGFTSGFEILRDSWRGDNADIFLKNEEWITMDMFNAADELIRVAQNLRRTSELMYRAEKSALYRGTGIIF